MKFTDYVSLRMEGEAARQIGKESPPKRIVGAPMSQSGFMGREIKHGEYNPKNFDRYPFKPDENEAIEYAGKMGRMVHGDMQVCVEALAGYYGNDGIVKAWDDFLSRLAEMKIKV